MRKTTVFIVCILLLAAVVTSVAATGVTLKLSADKDSAYRGGSVTVTVKIDEMEACKSGSLKLSFDGSVFTRSEEKWLFSAPAADPTGDAVFAFSAPKKISGNLYSFKLTVGENAAFGKYAVTVKLTLKDEANASTQLEKTLEIEVKCKHAWGDGTVTKEATCSEKGTKNYTCSVCGDTKTENIDKIAHTYTNNCDTQCDVCDATRTITHKWDDGKVTTKPTCTDKGEVLYTCKVCKETKTETLAKTGHSYDNDCDTSCNTCGATRDTEHDYMDRWTFDETGHWHACSNCGDILELTSHTWQQGSTDTEAGKITYTCTVCGASKVEDIPVVPSEPSEPTGPSDPSTGATEDPTPGTTDSTTGTDPQDPTGGDSEDPTEPSQGTDEKEKINIPWWIIAAAVAVLAVFCGIFLVIGVAIGSRQQGKYSR